LLVRLEDFFPLELLALEAPDLPVLTLAPSSVSASVVSAASLFLLLFEVDLLPLLFLPLLLRLDMLFLLFLLTILFPSSSSPLCSASLLVNSLLTRSISPLLLALILNPEILVGTLIAAGPLHNAPSGSS
jgi:hypothetical protein